MLDISTLTIWRMNNVSHRFFSWIVGLCFFRRPYTFFGFYKVACLIDISEYPDMLGTSVH